jgi:sialidase-1
VSERLGRSGDESDTNLVQRSSSDGGKTWGPITLAVPGGGSSSAPWAVPDDNTGETFLFFNANSTGGQTCNCLVSYVSSTDDGETWSSSFVPIPESSGFYGSSLTTGITLKDGAHKGRLITCMRKICRNSCPADYHSFAAYSDDHGKTWNVSDFLQAGTTECQIAELSDGQLYMSIRAYIPYPAGFKKDRLFSLSQDGGASWGTVKEDPSLVDSGGCAGSVVSHGKSVFYSHPDSTSRTNMTLYVSRDDASTWTETTNIYEGGSAYSSLAMLSSGTTSDTVGVFFEKDQYAKVSFASVAVPI